jgi:frataxin-like iron-binding protein CyaY
LVNLKAKVKLESSGQQFISNRFGKDLEEDVTENCTRFKKVPYDSLNARQKELFNFQKIAATLADCGFNCIKLADDWQGADFLAYNINGTTTLKVQLKSRLTIDKKKYSGKEIWIAFPYKGYWYLIEHVHLVEKVGKHTKWLNSDSWKNKDGYHSTNINPNLLKSLAEDRLGPVYGAVLEV